MPPEAAPQATPQDPKDAPALAANGAPLTFNSSLEELLASPEPVAAPVAPPPDAPLPPIIPEVPGSLGESVAGKSADATAPEPPAAEPPAGESESGESADTSPEPAKAEPAQAVDEDALIERLTEQKVGLLRTKGRQAQEIGDLRQQVAYLTEQVAAAQAQPYRVPAGNQPAISREELVTQLLDRPDEVIPQAVLQSPQFAQAVRELSQAMIVEQAQAWQAQQIQERSEAAPEVAKDVFVQRHNIPTDFNTWLATPEGQGVNDLVERDGARSRLLSAYVGDGDVKGIVSTLSKALEAHRLGKKAATARYSQNGETARVQAARPPSTPVKATSPPPPPAKAKSILDPWDETDLHEFLKGAESYQREG